MLRFKQNLWIWRELSDTNKYIMCPDMTYIKSYLTKENNKSQLHKLHCLHSNVSNVLQGLLSYLFLRLCSYSIYWVPQNAHTWGVYYLFRRVCLRVWHMEWFNLPRKKTYDSTGTNEISVLSWDNNPRSSFSHIFHLDT